MCIRLFYKYLTSIYTELTHVCTLCATIVYIKCIKSLNASSSPFPFLHRFLFLHFVAQSCTFFHFPLFLVLLQFCSLPCLCHRLCFVPVCVSGHQLHSLIQHLKFVEVQLQNHFILSVPLISKTTLLVSIMEPPIMTITLYQYQYTSHFSQGLKPPFLKLGRVTLPFYYNLHGTNVI